MNFLSRLKGSSSANSENSTAGIVSAGNTGKQKTTRSRSDKSPLRTIQSSLNRLFGSSNSSASFDSPHRSPRPAPSPVPSPAPPSPNPQPDDVSSNLTEQAEAQYLMHQQQNLEDYKRKLSRHRKESQKRPSKPNKALSITLRDNIAYTKSRLMQDQVTVSHERRKSKSENEEGRKKNQSLGGHRNKKDSTKMAPSSGISVASEPIMPSHYNRSNLTYLDIDSEYQEMRQLGLALPENGSLQSTHPRYHASTGQLNKDPFLRKQHRLNKELASHNSEIVLSMPQQPLWYSNDNMNSMQNIQNMHIMQNMQNIHSIQNLHASQVTSPVSPYFAPNMMFHPLDSNRYYSQPVVNQAPNGTRINKAVPKKYSVPVVPSDPQYNRCVSYQELRTYNREDLNRIPKVDDGEQNQPPAVPPRKNLRVPLGLQHQFYQPPPRALQKVYDAPDAYTKPAPEMQDDTVFKVPRPVGEVKSVHSARSKQRATNGNEKRGRDNGDQSRTPDSSGQRVPKKVQRHMPPVFLGESDLEEEGDDDVFLEPDQPFLANAPTKDYLFEKPVDFHKNDSKNAFNSSLTDVIKHANQHNAQFEELKLQTNDAIKNEPATEAVTTRRKSRKNRKLNDSESRHSKGEMNKKKVSEEHESSSTNNSGLGEPFVPENVPQVVINTENSTNLPTERAKAMEESKIPPHRRLGDQINVSYLLNESDLNLDTSYTANMVKVEKFLQRLDPVTEAYLQQTPNSNDVYPKMKHRKRKTSGEAAKEGVKPSNLTLTQQDDTSVKEIKKLQQVRRRAARNGAPQVQRPITPPSQRPSRRGRSGDRCVSAPPKSSELTQLTYIEQYPSVNCAAQYDEASEYISQEVQNFSTPSDQFQDFEGIMYV